jgi:hypothetical protein
MGSSNDKIRQPLGPSNLTPGVAAASGGVVGVRQVHTKLAHVVKHKVEIPSANLTVTSSVGGAQDSQSIQLLQLPQGKWFIMGCRSNVDITPQAGLSAASAGCVVGTTIGTDGTSTLAAGHYNVSGNLSAGALVAATKTDFDGITCVSSIVGSTTADTPVYLTISGTWVHATLTSTTVNLSGSIELTMIDLGDI